MTFVFGGTCTTSQAIHTKLLVKNGEDQVRSERLRETTKYVSGTYSLTCAGGFDFHYANGSV